MQKLTQPALYEKLKAFRFDAPGTAFPIALRLANAKGWSQALAERALGEYLRFVYLATISKTELTPSLAVDEVWHLHLEDAENYRRMCDEVLGKPLHHHAGDGKPGDAKRFSQQYRRTLTQYQMEFGSPPGDVWPQRKPVFGRRKSQPVVAAAAAALPKPVGLFRRAGAKLFLGIALLGGGSAVYGLVFGAVGLVLIGFPTLVVAMLVRAMLQPAQAGTGGSSCGGGGCGSSGSDGSSNDSGSDGGSDGGGGGCGGGGD